MYICLGVNFCVDFRILFVRRYRYQTCFPKDARRDAFFDDDGYASAFTSRAFTSEITMA